MSYCSKETKFKMQCIFSLLSEGIVRYHKNLGFYLSVWVGKLHGRG